jgi:hypothetical protein
MSIDRSVAVASAGFSTFLNLYSPQALLPSLARDFGVGAGAINGIMTASALAIAHPAAGWPGCVAMVIAMLAAMALIAARAYRRQRTDDGRRTTD